MLAQSAHTEKLAVARRDKHERQAASMHVGAKFGGASLKCLVAQNFAIVIECLLRERRNELGMLH